MMNIQNNFKFCLEVESLDSVSIERLLGVLHPVDVCDRMRYRKDMSMLTKKYPFGKVTPQGLHENFNKFKVKRSEIIGFKSRNYAVSENGGYATCVI
jgi:hypothetical protein